jgi:hypothetical protein
MAATSTSPSPALRDEIDAHARAHRDGGQHQHVPLEGAQRVQGRFGLGHDLVHSRSKSLRLGRLGADANPSLATIGTRWLA